MIFRFTEEEHEKLEKLYREVISNVAHGKITPYECKNSEFQTTINQIEQEHFKQLKTPEEIIKNAVEIAKDAILYEYAANSYVINHEDGKTEVLRLTDDYINISDFVDLVSWYFKQERFLKQLKEQDKTPKVVFEQSSFLKHLKTSVLNLHIEALKETLGAEDLEKEIDKVLNESIFIISDEDIKEPPFIVENGGVNRKFVDTSKYTAMNSLVSSQMVSKSPKTSKKEIPGQYTMQWDIIEKEVVYVATIDLVNDRNIYINAKVDAYDMAIINAVGSLYIAHQAQEPGEPCYLTPMDIWRFMNGKEANDKSFRMSPNQEKQLLLHIDKLRFTKFEIDLRSQMEKWGISFDNRYTQKTGKADDAILNLSGVQIYTTRNKNQSTYGFRVNTEPILFTYSRYRKQIITVDKSLLNVTNKKNLGENTIVIKNYLLKRIENYKHGYLSSNIIKLETIYRETGIVDPEQRVKEEAHTSKSAYLTAIRKERAKDCKEIEHILSTWEAAKYIKSYKKEGQGNEINYVFEVDKRKGKKEN